MTLILHKPTDGTEARTRSVAGTSSTVPAPCLDSSTGLPIAFVDGLLVNGRDLRISMVEQKPGQADPIQRIASLARAAGGFHTFGAGTLIRARIQFTAIDDVYSARLRVMELRNQLIGLLNSMNPMLLAAGGGCKDIEAHLRQTSGTAAQLEMDVMVEVPDRSDTRAVEGVICTLMPLVEQLTHGARGHASISDLVDRQLLCAQVTFDADSFPLAPAPACALAGRIVDLYNYTCIDADRLNACNAAILAAANGVHAMARNTGGDTEYQQHAWKAHAGHGAPLAIWYRDHRGHLAGRIALPLQVEHADTLAVAATDHAGRNAPNAVLRTHLLNHAVAAVALIQSLACLHANATAFIAQNNPAQHAHDLALMVGARDSEIEHVVQTLVAAGSVRCDSATTALNQVRGR